MRRSSAEVAADAGRPAGGCPAQPGGRGRPRRPFQRYRPCSPPRRTAKLSSERKARDGRISFRRRRAGLPATVWPCKIGALGETSCGTAPSSDIASASTAPVAGRLPAGPDHRRRRQPGGGARPDRRGRLGAAGRLRRLGAAMVYGVGRAAASGLATKSLVTARGFAGVLPCWAGPGGAGGGGDRRGGVEYSRGCGSRFSLVVFTGPLATAVGRFSRPR